MSDLLHLQGLHKGGRELHLVAADYRKFAAADRYSLDRFSAASAARMVQEVFEPWQGMCADGRMRNGRAADGPRKEGSEVLEKKPEEPARNVTAGPCGPGLEEKCGDWVVGRDDGLPSPEPQLPRSSPSGSETGEASTCV